MIPFKPPALVYLYCIWGSIQGLAKAFIINTI